MFRKKLLNSYTLAEVVIVMLIIAVIVAVSIRITKAKLDKVITYSYYSAYSTLSSVAETMASDIRNKRVDEEYLTLKYFIEDMKLGFRNNVAHLRAFFAYNFVPPAYAGVSLKNWQAPRKAYDCEAEHYFNSDICNGSYANVYNNVWGGRGIEIGNKGSYIDTINTYVTGTFAAACWNGSNYLYDHSHLPNGESFLTGESQCRLRIGPTEALDQKYFSNGPATLYHCGFQSDLNRYSICHSSYGCHFGYDIADADFVHQDVLDSRDYVMIGGLNAYGTAIQPTCGQRPSEYFMKLTCGQSKNNGLPNGKDVCRESCVFGRAKDFSELRNKYAKTCRPAHDVGLNGVHHYIYDHGAGTQDISDQNYYVRLNKYTYNGTCYYAAKRCSKKTQILAGVGYAGTDALTTAEYERTPETYVDKVVCIERPCDFINLDHLGSLDAHDAQDAKDLLPDYCNPEPEQPSGGGGGGGGGGSVDPDEPDEPTPEPDEPDCDLNPANAPCGQELDEESCSYVEKEGFSRDCPEGKTWDETICGCEENDDSFTGNGAKFCELFETYLNKKGGTSVCSGNGITSNTTDFTGKKPDLILRNGIAIYNLSANDAAVIPELVTVNVVESEDMSDENREILNNQKGYIIYADVDGQNNGDSKLWEDVYPFYITLSGKVIPVFDKTANPDGSGGDSVNHLQMNVVRKRFQQRGLRWVAQGVSFQEAACRSGYIDFRAPYCDGYQIDPGCNINSNNVSSCQLRPVKPIGFFF